VSVGEKHLSTHHTSLIISSATNKGVHKPNIRVAPSKSSSTKVKSLPVDVVVDGGTVFPVEVVIDGGTVVPIEVELIVPISLVEVVVPVDVGNPGVGGSVV